MGTAGPWLDDARHALSCTTAPIAPRHAATTLPPPRTRPTHLPYRAATPPCISYRCLPLPRCHCPTFTACYPTRARALPGFRRTPPMPPQTVGRDTTDVIMNRRHTLLNKTGMTANHHCPTTWAVSANWRYPMSRQPIWYSPYVNM